MKKELNDPLEAQLTEAFRTKKIQDEYNRRTGQSHLIESDESFIEKFLLAHKSYLPGARNLQIGNGIETMEITLEYAARITKINLKK